MKNHYMIAGTYTDTGSKGIYVYSNGTDGAPVEISNLWLDNPSFIISNPEGTHLYVTCESKEPSSVHSLAFDQCTGGLTHTGAVNLGNEVPAHLCLLPSGRHIVTANYGGGSISVVSINDDGSLCEEVRRINFAGNGPDEERQEGPHAHCVRVSPDESRLLVTDLGTDSIYLFELGEGNDPVSPQYQRFAVPPGSGPRHVVFHPLLPHILYLVTEMSGELLVLSMENDSLEVIREMETDTVHPSGGADIHITPDGRFLYASNRDVNDGIALYNIDPDGMPSRTGYTPTGKHPRNMCLAPGGQSLYVACRDDNVIQHYTIDDRNGNLRQSGNNIQIPHPVCILFVEKA